MTEQPNEEPHVPQEGMSVTKDILTIPVQRSAHFAEIYANYVSLATSPWDITLMFGRAVSDDPRHPYIEQRLSATLSPQAAKAMAELLIRNIAAYEQQYGEIRYAPIQPQTEEPSA